MRYRGFQVEQEVPVRLVYRDIDLEVGYRIDLLVEKQVVVEVKVVRTLEAVHTSQVLSYLRLSGLRVGPLFNFNVKALAAGGMRRILYDP